MASSTTTDPQPKPFKDLLQTANDISLSAATAGGCWRLDYLRAPQENLFRPPATADEIVKLEERLGISLPDDYKEFLSITNGFGFGDAPESVGVGIWGGILFEPPLFSIEKVNWNSEPYVQMPVDLLDLPFPIVNIDVDGESKNGSPSILPNFDRVLEIGSADIDRIWLVHPELVKKATAAYIKIYDTANDEQKKIIKESIIDLAGSMEAFKELEWCCVTWAAGGAACMRGYAGFRQYIECVVEGGLKTKAPQD